MRVASQYKARVALQEIFGYILVQRFHSNANFIDNNLQWLTSNIFNAERNLYEWLGLNAI